MKKLLILLIILICPQVYAFEDYVIVSENPVKSIYCEDEEIVSVLPFFTIDNSKNTILLKSKKEGNTFIVIETTEGEKNINIQVQPQKTVLPELDGLTYFVLDKPLSNDIEKPTLRGK